MRKNFYIKLIFIGLGLMILTQCTEVSNQEKVHPDGWETSDSENFHGKKIISSGIATCLTCHGSDENGGNVGISCFDCHEGGPSGHPVSSQWLSDSSDAFHGLLIAANGPGDCSVCHGDDYMGGSSGQSCFTCHEGGPSGHPASSKWLDESSSDFHGNEVAANGPGECSTCHGDDYTGGTSEQSCFTCHGGGPSGHPANSEWLDDSSDDYHGRVLWENGWDFTDCQSCHGSSLDGGTANQSCGTCHTGSSVQVFTCTTCHGNSELGNINPPEGIMGETESTDLSVGAHEAHLKDLEFSVVINCSECHTVPDTWDAAGHLGTDSRAEVTFGLLASDSGSVSPAYDPDTGTCSNVYCHGNFQFNGVSGNNPDFIWNSSAEAECGSCHGIAPTGHSGSYTDIGSCYLCHGSVVDSNGEIIDKSLHINGKEDFN